MPDSLTTNSPIIAAYRAGDAGLGDARRHGGRAVPERPSPTIRAISSPTGSTSTNAQGPRANGMSTGVAYVDYFGGPRRDAARPLPSRGDGGGCMPSSIAAPITAPAMSWRSNGPRRVMRLIPSAERVAFLRRPATEATLMAVRLAPRL